MKKTKLVKHIEEGIKEFGRQHVESMLVITIIEAIIKQNEETEKEYMQYIKAVMEAETETKRINALFELKKFYLTKLKQNAK